MVLVFVFKINQAQNLVVNGDFSNGNTDFTTGYNYCNTSGCLFPFSDDAYAVGTDASFYHHLFTGIDHTTGTGNFMIVNGGDTSRIAWSQAVTVQQNTDYDFSAWVATVYASNEAPMEFFINDTSIGTINAPSSINSWIQFTASWNSGSATVANIVIKDINTSPSASATGSDFGLDDISFIVSPASGVDENKILKSTIIHSNPANQFFTISTRLSNYQVHIYDAMGREVKTINNQSQNTTHDISFLPSGVYLINIMDAKGKPINRKLVKE